MSPVLLSVVVIGRNEGTRLARCLRSIEGMEDPGGPIEVIYVDSASSDGSPELAAGLGAQVISVQPQRPTAALGRNAGWRGSTGSFVLFLDGDTILDPAFVRESLRDFQPEIAAVWGHRREIHPEASVYNRVLDLDWIAKPGIVDFCGGDAILRRTALEAVGGYDETLIAGEEPEMCRRMRALGCKILHVDRPMTGHDLAMTRWTQYWRRATRTGYAYAEVSERFRGSGLPFWEAEARHNRKRATMLSAIVTGALLASVVLWNVWPGVIALALLAALVIRTARKVSWKASGVYTLLLYGIHSHLQQIPIYVGQRQYWKDRRAGRNRGLIEYKQASS